MTLVAVLLTLAAGERMRRGVFDSWQRLSPRELSASDVRVVMVDNQSVEFLPKPYSLDQINSKVKEVLGKIED